MRHQAFFPSRPRSPRKTHSEKDRHIPSPTFFPVSTLNGFMSVREARAFEAHLQCADDDPTFKAQWCQLFVDNVGRKPKWEEMRTAGYKRSVLRVHATPKVARALARKRVSLAIFSFRDWDNDLC